ncbi:hypothetical protein GRW13_23805, partial [Escherichia coli]|nr:hypothetical protein [Escherichia coli]
ASTTLTKNGWIFSTADSVREKTINKQNIPLAFTLTIPDIPFLKRTAGELQSAWLAIGARATINAEPPELVRDTDIKNRDYEALLYGNLLDGNDDLFSFWHSSERFSPGLNLALYTNSKADALIESIRENGDQNARIAQFASLEDMI